MFYSQITKLASNKRSRYSPSNPTPTCPPVTSGVWNVDPLSALPTLGQVAKVASAGSNTSEATGTTNGTTPSQTAKSGAEKLQVSYVMVLGLVALLF